MEVYMKIQHLAVAGALAGGAVAVGLLAGNGKDGLDVQQDRQVSAQLEQEVQPEAEVLPAPADLRVAVITGTEEEYHRRVQEARAQYEEAQEALQRQAKRYANQIDLSQVQSDQEDAGEQAGRRVSRDDLDRARQQAEARLDALQQARAVVAQELCEGGVIQGNPTVCLTTKPEHLREIKPEGAREQLLKKVLYCEAKGNRVVTEPSSSLTTGVVLADNILVDMSLTGIWTEYDRQLASKCCAGCPENCWVSPGSHGQCPYCLCNNSCANYCPKK